jgi:5-methylthioadenosine/S-adenosylhomocysteine deaminase
MDSEIGSIEVGKWADLTAIDLGALEVQPVYNPISQVVYAAGRHQVTDVWVAGQRVLDNRVLTTIDVDRLGARTREWQQRIANPAGPG